MATTRKSDTDRSIDQILERVLKIEAKLELFSKRLDEVENGYVAQGLQADDKIKDVASECDSKITSSELRSESRVEVLGKKLQDVSDKTIAIELRIGEMNKEWPTLQEAKLVKETKKPVNKTSFAEEFKSKAKDTIVLVGDSLARGVGQKLEQQSHMVTTKSRGGARIEQVTEQIGLLQDNVDRHLLVLVGTNNVENDSSEAIRLKYRSLLEASKKVKNRKVSVIGIPRRYDLSGYQNSRRIGANLELEKMCVKHDIGFIAYEPYRSRIAKDEIHFNHVGQDELARMIFEHCKSFLV
jgi:lysophospholipase L1-like esterase